MKLNKLLLAVSALALAAAVPFAAHGQATVNAMLDSAGAPGYQMSFSGGQKSSLNITSVKAVKASAGRAIRVSVIVAGTTAGSVNDVATTGGVAATNQILAIPANAAAGSTYYLDWPCTAGIVVTPGTGGTISITYN